MQPIFMVGMQRSGSNLLRLMLNQLKDIASPHPPHILQRLYPLLDHYGDLSNRRSFAVLADDVCRLVELNPVPWDGVRLDRDDVLSRCRENSLMALHGAAYDVCAMAWDALTWCSKSLANIYWVEAIEQYFAAPKYIYLYRDGRDVALSFRKAVVGEKHIYNIAKAWAKIQEIGLALRKRIPPDRFFALAYEELTAEPESTARRLCMFLGVDYVDKMLEFHHSDEAKRAAGASTLWGNLTQPVITNNTGKFLHEASVHDVRIFESVAGHVLDRLGYERVYVRNGDELVFSELEIKAFHAENERLKHSVVESIDKDDLERRDRQASLISEIRSRAALRSIA